MNEILVCKRPNEETSQKLYSDKKIPSKNDSINSKVSVTFLPVSKQNIIRRSVILSVVKSQICTIRLRMNEHRYRAIIDDDLNFIEKYWKIVSNLFKWAYISHDIISSWLRVLVLTLVLIHTPCMYIHPRKKYNI